MSCGVLAHLGADLHANLSQIVDAGRQTIDAIDSQSFHRTDGAALAQMVQDFPRLRLELQEVCEGDVFSCCSHSSGIFPLSAYGKPFDSAH